MFFDESTRQRDKAHPQAQCGVLRDHGRKVRGGLITQITNSLKPYCSDPNLPYFAGDKLCADVRFAVFGPTGSGEAVAYC